MLQIAITHRRVSAFRNQLRFENEIRRWYAYQIQPAVELLNTYIGHLQAGNADGFFRADEILGNIDDATTATIKSIFTENNRQLIRKLKKRLGAYVRCDLVTDGKNRQGIEQNLVFRKDDEDLENLRNTLENLQTTILHDITQFAAEDSFFRQAIGELGDLDLRFNAASKDNLAVGPGFRHPSINKSQLRPDNRYLKFIGNTSLLAALQKEPETLFPGTVGDEDIPAVPDVGAVSIIDPGELSRINMAGLEIDEDELGDLARGLLDGDDISLD